MDAGSALKLVSYAHSEFYIGGEWRTVTPKYPLPAFMVASSEAKKSNLQKGAFFSVKKSPTNKQTSVQCVLVDVDVKPSTPFGALSALMHYRKWAELGSNKTAVLILPVTLGDKSNYYWVTAIAPSGHAIRQFERLLNNVYDIPKVLSEIELTESPHYFYTKDDVAISTLLEQHKEDRGGNIDISHVNEALLKTSLTDPRANARQLFRKSSIEFKKAGGIGAALFALGVGAFGYSYFDTRESTAWLLDEAISAEIASAKKELSTISEGFKTSKSWTPISYKETTIEQFVSNMKNDFSATEVALMLREIERIMPLYAADWTMSKISYVDGDFLVYYTRDKLGKGVFFLLDDAIARIQVSNPDVKINGFGLLAAAQERIYKISRLKTGRKDNDKTEILSALSAEKGAQNALRRLLQNATNEYADIEKIRQEAESLTFSERWIARSTKKLYSQALPKMDSAESLRKKVEKARKELAEMPKATVKPEWVLGSVLDFVILMQTDSLFSWSYPEVIKTYPDEKTLKEKAPKKKKSKKGSRDTVDTSTGPAIETYKVTVSTQTTDEIGKVLSYGVLDMIQLSLLIDRPFITVDYVEYDPKTEQWNLVLFFNRKTSEFDNRITSL